MIICYRYEQDEKAKSQLSISNRFDSDRLNDKTK